MVCGSVRGERRSVRTYARDGPTSGDLGAMNVVVAEIVLKPLACSVFDDPLGNTQSWSSISRSSRSDLPSLSFHSRGPLAGRPRMTPAAVDGELKG